MALAALAGASAASFEHEILHRSSKSRARVGILHTPHGDVQTPGFVPVATSAALKGVTPAQADAAGCELMFCNTCAAPHSSAHPPRNFRAHHNHTGTTSSSTRAPTWSARPAGCTNSWGATGR